MNLKSMNAWVITLVLTGLVGCATQPDVPPLELAEQLPDVAALYSTTREVDTHDGHMSADIEWRFFREGHTVEIENLQSQTGERWQRDGATLFLVKLFHEDRRGIEYRSDDLRVLDISQSWRQQALLIDPDVLQKLPLYRAGWRDGYPYRRYRGTIDNITVDIVWRVDLNLPQSIEREHDGQREVTRLIEAHTLTRSPWQRRDSTEYEIIDYADLGDRERDPFVIRIQTQLPGGHIHSH